MYKKISVKDWIAVEDNPIQRDTEGHARKAKHLLTPHPTHQFVFAAEMPNGSLIKLDGHTRALIWKRGDVPQPTVLYMATIPVRSKAEAEQLYKDFDSKDALETTRDKMSGAYNRHNFEPKSPLLQTGALTSALKIASAILRGMSPTSLISGPRTKDGPTTKKARDATGDVYDMVDEWSYELHALDGFLLRQGQASGGVIAAFLVSFRRHGHLVTPFWTGVFGNEGSKHGHQMDAIQATVELLMRRKGAGGGASLTADVTARCLGGVEKFMKDETLTRIPSPIDTTDYLKGKERTAERLIKARDKKAA